MATPRPGPIAIPAAPPPVSARWHKAARTLFAGPLNSFITLGCLLFIGWLLPPLLRWGVLDAVWTGTAQECHAAAGACWSFIREKMRFFFFGMYPADERWRAFLSMLLLIGTTGLAMVPRFWGGRLLIVVAANIAVAVWLLVGGLGLRPVATEQIGGLPATLMLSLVSLPLGFPLAVLLAFGRRSRFWLFRGASTAFIEILRCSPMVAILFMASVMLPFFVPSEYAPPKLARACFAFTIVAAAYMAEALRGGIQAVPEGQREAAIAVGMRPLPIVLLIILPQAIRMSIPGLLNVVVAFFKDTSLIVVIGMADFLGAIQLATRDPAWSGFNVEGYVFAALVYFTFCSVLSRYGQHLERRQNHDH